MGYRSREGFSGKITFRFYFENKFFSSFWLNMYIELVHLFHSFIKTYKKKKKKERNELIRTKKKEKTSDKKCQKKSGIQKPDGRLVNDIAECRNIKSRCLMKEIPMGNMLIHCAEHQA